MSDISREAVVKRREDHVKTLQEMKNVMQSDDGWERLMPMIEAVIAGGMALQVLNNPVMLAKHLHSYCLEHNNGDSCEGCPFFIADESIKDVCWLSKDTPECWNPKDWKVEE